MRTIILVFITLASFTGLATGKVVELDEFFNINAVGNYKVTLIKGDSHKVKIINNDEDVLDKNIVVENNGGELILKLKKDTYRERNIEFIVFYKELFSLKAKRGAYMVVKDELTSEAINVEVNSGAHIMIGVNSKSCDFSIRNGGTIDVKGSAESAKFYVSKGGNILGFNLISQSVNAEVLFGGEILLHVTKSLVAVVKSGGVIKYKGKPVNVSDEIKIGGQIIKLEK